MSPNITMGEGVLHVTNFYWWFLYLRLIKTFVTSRQGMGGGGEEISPNVTQGKGYLKSAKKCHVLFVRLGFCLDVVLIETLNIDTVKKLVSTIKKISTISKSLGRQSRNLDFVSTPPSRSKYLDQDLPQISIISWSRLRISYDFHKSWLRSSYDFHKCRSRLLLLIHFTNRHLWNVETPRLNYLNGSKNNNVKNKTLCWMTLLAPTDIWSM